ncbi:MAG: hypothetical protein HRT88_14975 [Lentisphaeraceae bacterium]|nr:hypothetical protein [Lentisphaeraceae bacterium]
MKQLLLILILPLMSCSNYSHKSKLWVDPNENFNIVIYDSKKNRLQNEFFNHLITFELKNNHKYQIEVWPIGESLTEECIYSKYISINEGFYWDYPKINLNAVTLSLPIHVSELKSYSEGIPLPFMKIRKIGEPNFLVWSPVRVKNNSAYGKFYNSRQGKYYVNLVTLNDEKEHISHTFQFELKSTEQLMVPVISKKQIK